MVRSKLHILFVFVFLSWNWQSVMGQMRFENISGNEGLSQNTVRSIIQDQHGFFWIGTYNGINKYDGNTMTHYKFSNSNNGLSSNIILSLFEDSKGNIWAGTPDAGINRINTNTGKISHYFSNSDGLNFTSDIADIYEAENGQIFYKKGNGIFVFDPQKEATSDNGIWIQELNGFDFQNIRNIIPSEIGGHWIFSPGNPKIKLSYLHLKESQESSNYQIKTVKNFPMSLFDQGYAISLFEYDENTLLILSSRLEIMRLELNEQQEVTSYDVFDLKSSASGIKDIIYRLASLEKDKNGKLWVAGTNLLLNYNLETNEVRYFDQNEELFNQISTQQAQTLLVDATNILWIGTLNNGLYKLDLESNTFLNSDEFTSIAESLNNPFHQYPVLSMTQDLSGNIWLGTQGEGGISVFKEEELIESINATSKKPWQFNYITKDRNAEDNPELFELKRLMTDSKGNVWAGGRGGLSKLKLTNDNDLKIQSFDSFENEEGELIDQTVFAIEEDENGNIWAGYWNNGLVRLRADEDSSEYAYDIFQYDSNNKNSLSNNYVRAITEDSNANIWVGTMGGLNKLTFTADDEPVFERFLYEEDNINSLSNNYILDIYQARNGILYIGTFGGGLNSLTIDNNNNILFERIGLGGELANEVVYQIKEDVEGNIWLLHVREISKLNPKTGEISRFQMEDGFSVSEFKDNAMLLTSSGIMICGGSNGVTFFQPNKLSVNTMPPKLAFTNFKLFNESIVPGMLFKNNVVLEKDINLTNRIELPYSLNSIEFNFASLHFSNPVKNRYRFMLEGFEENWQTVSGIDRNFASYPNLPYGDYVFKVYGSNSNGVWMEAPRSIAVIISPPWYLTAWAIVLFSLLFVTLIYIAWKVRVNQLKLKNELRLEHLMHEKSEELNKVKLQFFTNISHELRTPLTLIIGPLQQILKENTDKAYLKKLNLIMYKNSVRLLKLINQLLDFRKAESGNINLLVQHGDISFFVEEIYNAFEEIAIEKQIKFVHLKSHDKILGWFDTDKIEKILYNLLSNAFKYTPKGKSIKLVVQRSKFQNNEAVLIKVIDYGVGIRKKDLKSIFERFYQAKNEDDKVHLGSGLGLAYTKHLVEIHGGEIDIQSELHKGTTCSITIPITREAYDTNAVVEMRPESHKFQFTQREIEDSKAMYIAGNKATGLIKHNEETPTILVVEDNEELNEYLVGYFNQEYNVIRAFDGKSGLDMVRNKLPDIIISDLMMPKLGGIEMCKMVKTDLKTSHIPVIILTAKAGIENEKEGLETGAEEFVLKPFNIELLKLRVDNILRNKSQWIEKFKSDDSTETWKELSNKLDKEFLEKGIAIVKSNIDNSEFTVAQFAMDMGMSRSSLFSKLKSITNQSTSEFIRNIRLKKAATLIKTGRYSITEVVFLTGFSDPKYFRTCFKKLYDKTPSEYLNDFKVKS